MKHITIGLFLLTAVAAQGAGGQDMVLDIDLSSRQAEVSPAMYGIFFEEINHAGDGGLYGEMLMNRSFEERVMPEGYHVENGALVPPVVDNYITGEPTTKSYRWGDDPFPGWEIIKRGNAAAEARTVTDNPNFATAPTSLRLTVKNPGKGVALVNKGYWGVALQKDARYRLRMYVRTADGGKDMTVRLTGASGEELGSVPVTLDTDGEWHEYKAVLQASDTTSDGRLSIELPGAGTYYFDYVSLFPEDTYKGRENGMRKDVALMLEELHPGFVRWPGGCVVEGITLNNRFDWKKTLGDPASRPGEYDTWGYRTTYGFGYKEFLDFCEDLGAKGMYVCNVGLACYGRSGEYCSDEEALYYIQDALDAIEYAIGDTDSRWGAVRAAEGHPEPYPLAYVEIGNENFGPIYDRRYNMFYKAIKEKYPNLTLISNYGLEGSEGADTIEMVDPHWYVEPKHFFNTTRLIDNYERGKHDIYVGEYSCNQNVGGGNMLAALSEAAFLTGIERNGDIVKMASYAPLIENRNDRAWPVNLIWVDNDQVVGRSSYYVQKMFAQNRPDYNLKVNADIKSADSAPLIGVDSYIGLGTWSTQTQFRNLKVTDANGNVIKADMNDDTQWVTPRGQWTRGDGVASQTGIENRTALIWTGGRATDGSVIEFEVKKTGGNEGFLCFFGLQSPDLKKGYMLNAGGWNNTASAIEGLEDDNSSPISLVVPDRLDSGRWCKARIVLRHGKAEYYLDNKLKVTYTTEPMERKFYAAGYDEASGEVILKIVNATPEKCKARITFTNGDVEHTGRVIVLKADAATDENSFDEPLRISPQEHTYPGFSSKFDYNFEPNSLTVIRLTKK